MKILALLLLLAVAPAFAEPAKVDKEMPLRSSMASIKQAFGTPDPHPIYTVLGKAPTKEDLANAFDYRRLSPPRFYQFRDGKVIMIHYNNLKSIEFDRVLELLRFHSSNSAFHEIKPQELGHDPTGLGVARAWRCPDLEWTALFRAYKDTSPSLLIYTDDAIIKTDLPIR